jgi:hypothetical protein
LLFTLSLPDGVRQCCLSRDRRIALDAAHDIDRTPHQCH